MKTRAEWTAQLLADVEALWAHMDEASPQNCAQAELIARTGARWLAEGQLKDVGDLVTLAVATLTFARESALVFEQQEKAS
jgi:hypothetical protein